VCAVLSSVCATTVDNSGVYVYYLKGIVSVSDLEINLYEATRHAEDRGPWKRTVHNVGCQLPVHTDSMSVADALSQFKSNFYRRMFWDHTN